MILKAAYGLPDYCLSNGVRRDVKKKQTIVWMPKLAKHFRNWINSELRVMSFSQMDLLFVTCVLS